MNRTLGDLLAAQPGLMVFGEDVAVKGGVYGVTRGLLNKAGAARVFEQDGAGPGRLPLGRAPYFPALPLTAVRWVITGRGRAQRIRQDHGHCGDLQGVPGYSLASCCADAGHPPSGLTSECAER